MLINLNMLQLPCSQHTYALCQCFQDVEKQTVWNCVIILCWFLNGRTCSNYGTSTKLIQFKWLTCRMRINELQVWASPEALGVSLSKTLCPLLSAGSTREDQPTWLKNVDWVVKYQIKIKSNIMTHISYFVHIPHTPVPEGVSVCTRGPEKMIALLVRGISEMQENRGWLAWIMVRSKKSKMAANMAANFMENEYIHKISCYDILPVCFWTQNV